MYGTVRTVVWEDGGVTPASYPICMEMNVPKGFGRLAKKCHFEFGGLLSTAVAIRCNTSSMFE